MISRGTNIGAALRSRQRGFLLNPYRFSSPGQQLLLLRGNGSDGSTPVDESPAGRTPSGAAKVSTTQSKYGGSSIEFNSTRSYLDYGTDAAYALNTSNFTMQFWLWISSSGATNGMSLFGQDGVAFPTGHAWVIFASSGTPPALNFYVYNSSGSQTVSFSVNTGTAYDTWMHVAVVRDGNTLRFYLDGVQKTASSPIGTFTAAIGSSSYPLRVGKAAAGFNQFTGYIDDLQYIVDACLYPNGTTFTPPGAL